MNTFFVSAGRTLANAVDGMIDLSRMAVTEARGAGRSFAAGWQPRRSMNAVERRYGAILEFKPVRA